MPDFRVFHVLFQEEDESWSWIICFYSKFQNVLVLELTQPLHIGYCILKKDCSSNGHLLAHRSNLCVLQSPTGLIFTHGS